MAHIEDRWYKTVIVDGKKTQVKKADHCKGKRYRVRYIGPDGREISESFPDRQKREAQDFLAQVQTDIRRGTYIDPTAGKTPLQQYASEWIAMATCDELTRDRLERQFRLHVYPTLGRMALSAFEPATIRSWNYRLQQAKLAASYRRMLFNDLSMIFNSAIDDKKLLVNPCAAKTVRAPKYVPAKVVPWTPKRLAEFREAVTERYRAAVDLGAGCGLRQGEIFAVSPDDVDCTRRVLYVVREIRLVRNCLVFAPPKGGKTREVPLPDSIRDRLDAHAKEFRPLEITLPWVVPTGEPHTVLLYLTTDADTALSRNNFNAYVWKRAIRAAGIEDNRRNGMHVLRHTYASMLLDAGESIKALSLYLGHHDPGFTLRTYTHLLPASEDRTRRAIDGALGPQKFSDGLDTA
jgi:integrase